MANIDGGVTGRPSGKLANIVFGAARTREGKQVTARELVKPSNPNTAAQQDQRSKFSEALQIVKGIGPSIYQDDWNRSVGQLPGFQSLQSIMLNNLDNSNVLGVPSDVPLGNLHFPDSFSTAQGSGAGEIDLTWSTNNPGAAAGVDPAVVIAIPQDEGPRDNDNAAVIDTSKVRADGAVTVTSQASATDHTIALYFRSATADAPPLSLAAWRDEISG